MSGSPFPFHGPLRPDQVRGRDDLIDDLVERVTDRRPTVLVAPRRFGKTSVLGRVAALLSETTTVVHLDLYELRSWADFAARIDAALSTTRGAARQAMDRLAASLQIDLGVVRAELGRRQPPPADALAANLVDILVDYAKNSPTLLILDEFSSIGQVDGAAGMLRTKLQHHYQDIGLLFAGSRPSTMRLLFSAPEQPFYAQADLIDVPPLSGAALVDIVDAGFDEAPAGLAAAIHRVTNGHPHRSMQLADAAWTLLRDRAGAVDPGNVWADALAAVQQSTAAEHETRFADLSPSAQAVLRLSSTGEPLFGRAAEQLNLSASSAAGSRRSLEDVGLLHPDGSVVDPLFGDWIRRRFS